jgi:hypothetical protein
MKRWEGLILIFFFLFYGLMVTLVLRKIRYGPE